MVSIQDLIRISDYEWEIPKTYRKDMVVPVRLFSTRRMLDQVMEDKSLEQAAKGMYALMGACIRPESRQTRDVELKASDPESLLVAFLSELLYFSEQESLVFDGIGIELNGLSLRAHLDGAPLASIDKEIKAVTYHKLAVRKTELGYEVNVVFDV